MGYPSGSPSSSAQAARWWYNQATGEREMTTDRIEINPEVMLGKPVIRGTRITVELILRKLSEGMSEAELLDAYPHLSREDIQSALAYAADTVSHETILLQPPSK